MSHTKGRLKADGDWIGLESDGDVTVAYIDASDNEETNEANARRLAACWNVLAEFSTEEIEAGTTGFLHRYVTVVDERHELLETLRICANYLSDLAGAWQWKKGERGEGGKEYDDLVNAEKSTRALLNKYEEKQ